MRSTIALFVCLLSATALATPLDIPYRGVLEQGGAPYDQPVTMSFTIYDAPTAGNPVWTSGDQTVQVVDGKFSVTLSGVEIGDLDANAALYLGVTVDGSDLAGRQRLLAVPYARKSQDGVPPGAVMFFGTVPCPGSGRCADESDCTGTGTCSAACPPGWSSYGPAEGRTMVGVGDVHGGTVGATVGTELTDAEARSHEHPHDHSVTNGAAILTGEPITRGCLEGALYPWSLCDPGRAADSTFWLESGAGAVGAFVAAYAPGSDGGGGYITGFTHNHSASVAGPNPAGAEVAHLPYLQLKACQKD